MGRTRVTARVAMVTLGALILASCSAGVSSPSPATSTATATVEASPSATAEPTSDLGPVVSLRRECENPPQVQPVVTIASEGRVVLALGDWSVRQLSPVGVDQVRQEVLEAPLLQTSAEYALERLPNPTGVAGVPVHGSCTYIFTIGIGSDAVVVRSVSWNGDDEEAQFYVPSPERKELDRLANLLMSLGDWLTADAWSDESWLPYESASYLLWVDPQAGAAPDGIPSSMGVTWPFAGAIDAFGDPIGAGRCGYLDMSQASETVGLLRDAGIETGLNAATAVTGLRTDAGWVRILLTPRTPDGFPSCADEALFQF